MTAKTIEYNGETYELVGQGFAEAQTGDIFVSNHYTYDIVTEGSVYEIKCTDEGSYTVWFTADSGAEDAYTRKNDAHWLYRKVSEPTQEDRIKALEEQVAKLTRKLKKLGKSL